MAVSAGRRGSAWQLAGHEKLLLRGATIRSFRVCVFSKKNVQEMFDQKIFLTKKYHAISYHPVFLLSKSGFIGQKVEKQNIWSKTDF